MTSAELPFKLEAQEQLGADFALAREDVRESLQAGKLDAESVRRYSNGFVAVYLAPGSVYGSGSREQAAYFVYQEMACLFGAASQVTPEELYQHIGAHEAAADAENAPFGLLTAVQDTLEDAVAFNMTAVV